MQKRIGLKEYGMIALMGIAAAVALNNLLMVVNLAQYSKAYQEAAEILYAPSFGKQILSSGLLVPIVEEVLFRGVVFKIARKWMPFWGAMILSAVLFGLYHGNLVQFVYAGLCGLLLAFFYEKYQTIFAPIFAHMVMNIASCTMTEFGVFSWMFEHGIKVTIVTAFCLFIFCFLFIRIQQLDITKMLKKYCKE